MIRNKKRRGPGSRRTGGEAKIRGGGGIRTHGTLSGSHAFQASRLNHSRTPPSNLRNLFSEQARKPALLPFGLDRAALLRGRPGGGLVRRRQGEVESAALALVRVHA